MFTVRFTARQFFGAIIILALIALALFATDSASAQGPTGGRRAPAVNVGTGFTYQGQLKNNGAPVNGTCTLAFRLYDDPSLGSQIGSAITQTVPITSGLFTTQLNSSGEFGATAFNGEARWLEISVSNACPSAGSFTTLAPRQALTPAPMAFALPGLYTQQTLFSPNIIGGWKGNVITSTLRGATISGGGMVGSENRAGANFATVGGGESNNASGLEATVDGGTHNTASAEASTVGGGSENTASSFAATVGGGDSNSASGSHATIGGGGANSASNSYTAIGGGISNIASAYGTTVGGGGNNSASKNYAAVGGGSSNSAGGTFATIPGGRNNIAVTDTLAAGRQAQANHQGSFVWADCNPCAGSGTVFATTADNQFLLRANGGMGVNTNSPAANTLTVGGAGLRVATDGTTFARIQSGTATLGSGSGGATNVYTVTYPSAFSSTPKVTATPRNDYPSWDVGDTFAVTLRRISTTQFVVNIFRVDDTGGWSQSLKLDWVAWE